MVRVYVNNVELIYSELESHPGISYEQLHFFRERASRFAYDLLLSFCSSINLKTFENIYRNFVPVKDYDSRCFKIVNEQHLKYSELKKEYFLKYRKDEHFDEKKFDLICLNQ